MRKFPEIKSSQFFIRAAAERAAVNFPIQSLAADVIKVAMINIHKVISGQWTVDSKSENPEIRMLLQVHDELVFEIPDENVDVEVPIIKSIMENAAKISVPIIVDCGVADNWADAH